ncbi:molybdenum cofactor guanylyltransferase [Aureimonas leprariae]|uniref:Molybdenum cofactor guanylyltransferase n=1 Tax=Plantimonas leprariae TaxID=2615207 RepID=A0A7V7U1F4_9HYPH|nr:molybdenum cofactor guanylyltransferase [Aureimonas leprariae]KAB0681887.1 molybdenum cofactor guanylyltransferase [Aureimonas leprariae]
MTAPRIAGLVLAGGRGSRLGAAVPKPMVEIGGRPMIAHVLDRFPPAVSPILIGVNDREAFAPLPYPIVRDRIDGHPGPLAALDAATHWLRERRDAATHLICLPGDTPFLPADVCARLADDPGRRPRIARCGGRLHPTVALWPLACLEDLRTHIEASGNLSVVAFAERTGFDAVDFDASTAVDPFFNVNTPDDLILARATFDALGI